MRFETDTEKLLHCMGHLPKNHPSDTEIIDESILISSMTHARKTLQAYKFWGFFGTFLKIASKTLLRGEEKTDTYVTVYTTICYI